VKVPIIPDFVDHFPDFSTILLPYFSIERFIYLTLLICLLRGATTATSDITLMWGILHIGTSMQLTLQLSVPLFNTSNKFVLPS